MSNFFAMLGLSLGMWRWHNTAKSTAINVPLDFSSAANSQLVPVIFGGFG
jgi:hypothetical protein